MNLRILETKGRRARSLIKFYQMRIPASGQSYIPDSTHGNSRTLVSLHEFPRSLLVAKHAPQYTGIDSSSVDRELSVFASRLCCLGCTYYCTCVPLDLFLHLYSDDLGRAGRIRKLGNLGRCDLSSFLKYFL